MSGGAILLTDSAVIVSSTQGLIYRSPRTGSCRQSRRAGRDGWTNMRGGMGGWNQRNHWNQRNQWNGHWEDYHWEWLSLRKSIMAQEYHCGRISLAKIFHFMDYSNLADFDADYPIRCGMTHPSRCDPLERLKTSKMRFFDFRPNFAKFDNSTTDRKLSPSCEQPSHRSAPPVFSTTATRDT